MLAETIDLGGGGLVWLLVIILVVLGIIYLVRRM